jgi:hypothetical protein
MNPPFDSTTLFAPDKLAQRERLKEALERSGERTKQTNEMIAATRAITEKFYYQVALLSGGTTVLSVTFLGYLESSNEPIRLLPLLLTAWAFLFLGLLGALYRNHHWMRQTHFQAVTEYLTSARESAEEILRVATEDPSAFVNLRTPDELKEFQERQTNKIQKLRENEPWHTIRMNRATNLLQACEWVAHIGLTVGVVLLLIFAGTNVWLRTKSLSRIKMVPSLHTASANTI